MFRLLEGKNMRSTECVQFLSQLKQNIKGPIIVIWDRLQAHRSKALKAWLAMNRRVEVEYFPPYAPELNPVEYLWAHLKSHELANFCALELEDLYDETKSKLCSIRKRRDLVRAFIDHSPANFFT
jgi:transposase